MRIHKAAKLLKSDWGSVSDVAYEVGFNNLSYFTKCFKAEYDQTPSEFQQLFNPLLKFHGNLTDSTLELHFKNWEEPKNVPSLSSKSWSNNQIKLHNVCYMAYRHWPIKQLGLK